MHIPVIQGVIDRRILVNFQVDPSILSQILPEPFQPKLIHGVGIAGVCLIRLKNIRPRFVGPPIGISSENAAHRIAVQWEEDGVEKEGVYIPRRDTSSHLNTLVGGRLFPGLHHHARFLIFEEEDRYRVEIESDDGKTNLLVSGRRAREIPSTSIFRSLEEASDFFERGAVGYSARPQVGKYDGLELRSLQWEVEPLEVEQVRSNFFENESLFPEGTVKFDCALLMRGIEHEWHGLEPLCV